MASGVWNDAAVGALASAEREMEKLDWSSKGLVGAIVGVGFAVLALTDEIRSLRK